MDPTASGPFPRKTFISHTFIRPTKNPFKINHSVLTALKLFVLVLADATEEPSYMNTKYATLDYTVELYLEPMASKEIIHSRP